MNGNGNGNENGNGSKPEMKNKPKTMFFLFNHHPTKEQILDAETALGVDRIVEMPPDIKAIWQQIPADPPAVEPILGPVKSWLSKNGSHGDIVLIQGDFGATYLMVAFAMELGLVPVYATTRRTASEIREPDGTIRTEHRFKHRRFRVYGC